MLEKTWTRKPSTCRGRGAGGSGAGSGRDSVDGCDALPGTRTVPSMTAAGTSWTTSTRSGGSAVSAAGSYVSQAG